MKQVIAIALMLAATQAQAWGAREQGMLIGIAGTLLTQQIMQRPQQPEVVVGGEIRTPQGTVRGQISTQPQYSVQYPQQPRMYIPAPARCQVVPVYDHWGRYIAQQTVCNW